MIKLIDLLVEVNEFVPTTKSKIKSALLNELPLRTYKTIGDFDQGYSFQDKRDRASISNPTTIHKLQNIFKNTDIDFDFYFVNKPGLRKFVETGQVTQDFIFNPYPDGLGIDKKQLKGGVIDKNAITVFYVSNVAGEKIPMTAWTIAHRLGHAIRARANPIFIEYTDSVEREFKEILRLYGVQERTKSSPFDRDRKYRYILGKLFETVGTMRSAREGKLHTRPYEFYFELFVQSIKDGAITFNPLPSQLVTGYSYGRKQYIKITDENKAEAQEILDQISRDIVYYINAILGSSVGKIYVM